MVLEADGLLSTPEQLQQLAELASVPEAFETTRFNWHGVEVGSATVCAITWDEKLRMDVKVEVRLGWSCLRARRSHRCWYGG